MVLSFGGWLVAQEICEPQYSIPNDVFPGSANNQMTGGEFRAAIVVGQPLTVTANNYFSHSVSQGFYSYYQKEPRPPVLTASDGDFQDEVLLEWVVEDQKTGPPVTDNLVTLYRNGYILTTLPVTQTEYQDFNVFAGEYYEYGVSSGNAMGESHTADNVGFLNPDGVITGHVETPSGNPVQDTKVILTPNLGQSAFFDGESYIFFFNDSTAANRLFDGFEGDYTIETWFRSIHTYQQRFFTAVDSATTDHYVILELTDDGKVRWQHSPDAGSPGDEIVTVNTFTEDMEWHHLAVSYQQEVYDADGNLSDTHLMKMYIDGAIVGHSHTTGPINDTVELMIGKNSPKDRELYFQGRLDDFRIWRTAREWSDIRKYMDLTLSGEEHYLEAYWKFDENEGDIIFDLTDNNIDGEICGVDHNNYTAPVYVGALTDSLGNYYIRGIYYANGTTFTATPSKSTPIGRALDFDGSDDYISFHGKRVDFTDGYTIEGWLKTGAADTQTLFAAVNPEDDTGRISIKTENGQVKYSHFETEVVSPLTYNDELWHHWAVTCNDTVSVLYMEGEEVASAQVTQVVSDLSEIVIGRQSPNIDDGHFDGYLDEIRVWTNARTALQVGGTQNQVLTAEEDGLIHYWRLNEGSGELLADATGNMVTGTLHGAFWTEDIPLNEYFTHIYEPESRQATLNHSNTAVDMVDFIDISMIEVSGFVRYQNTACFQDNVEILLNGESLFPPVYTDDDGKFSVELEPGSSGNIISPVYSDHTFIPPFIELPLVATPITALYFDDQITRDVYGSVTGGVCEFPITPTQGQIEVTLRAIDGCIETTVVPHADTGHWQFDDLPPLIYNVTVDHPDPDIDSFFLGDTLSLETGNGSKDYVYRSIPVVSVIEMPQNECGMNVMELNGPETLFFEIYETYTNQGENQYCASDSGSVTIFDYITATSPDSTFSYTNGLVMWDVVPGVPNILDGGEHPYQKNLQVSVTDHLQRNAATEVWTYVTGNKPRNDATYTTTTPEMPFMILRSPPGDGSSSTFEQGTSASQTIGFNTVYNTDANAYFGVHLGVDAEITVGLIVESTISVNATLDFSAEMSVGIQQESATEQTWTWNVNETFSTVGGGDVYIGGALNMLYGVTDVMTIDGCEVVITPDLILVPDGFATTYIYSEDFILGTLIPSLIEIGDETSAETWLNIVDRNTFLKDWSLTLAANPDTLYNMSLEDAIGLASEYFDGGTTIVPSHLDDDNFPEPDPEDQSEVDDPVIDLPFQDFFDDLMDDAIDVEPSLEAPEPDVEGLNRNISFDAGATYTYSMSTSAAKSEAVNFEMFIGSGVAVDAGIEVNGLGVFGGFQVAFQTTRGKTESVTTEQTTTTSFTLADDDPGDFFSVNVTTDGVYGPVFGLVGGASSCPWEEGSTPFDGTDLSVSPAQQLNVMPDEAAPFILDLGNTSPMGQEREYWLSVIQESNPYGAVVAVNGVVMEDHMAYLVPYGEAVQATVTVERGPVEYEYDDIQLRFYSPCDETVFADTVAISAHFLRPCSESHIAFPEDNWLVTSAYGQDSLYITVDGYDRGDEYLERIDLLYRPAVGYDREDDGSVQRNEHIVPLSYDLTAEELAPLNETGKGDIFLTGGGAVVTGSDIAVQGTDPETGGEEPAPRVNDWFMAASITPDELIDDYIILPWDISPDIIIDGEYELKAIAVCSGDIVPGTSNIITGLIDRNAPQPLGAPEPSDGILTADEEITIIYNEDVECGEISVGAEHITLYNTVTGNPVAFEYTCGGNQIVIDLDILQNHFYENQTFRASVGPIQDLYGNQTMEPIVWEFFVNRNPIEWIGGGIENIILYDDESYSTTRWLVNSGGSNRSWEMIDIPDWLDIAPTTGTLTPGNQQEITVSLNEQPGYGEYQQTVYASGVMGDEPMPVDIRVLCYPPDWEVVEEDFMNSMNIVALLTTDDELSSDTYDIVGVFAGEELRGVGNVQFVPELSELANTHAYEVFLTIYSNLTSGEELTLKVWDASECALLGYIIETFTFESNVILGSPTSPIDITATSQVIQEFTFPSGWRWFSMNLEAGDMGINEVLHDLAPTQDDQIKSQYSYSQFMNGYGWLGLLNTLTVDEMYMMKMAQPDTMNMLGYAVNIELDTLYLDAGWNWISFLPQQSYPVNDALLALSPWTGDLIKSQFDFAMYVENLGWIGDMDYMNPHLGYQIYLQNEDELVYPLEQEIGLTRTVSSGNDDREDNSGWLVNTELWANSMNVIAEIADSEMNLEAENLLIGAFVGDECRGKAWASGYELLDRNLFFITVYGDDDGETVAFRLFDNATGNGMELTETVDFSINDIAGSVLDPMMLTWSPLSNDIGLIPKVFALDQNFPNPFNASTTISYALPQTEQVELVIYNLAGQEVKTLVNSVQTPGFYQVNWNGTTAMNTPVPSGIYIYRITAGEFRQMHKLVILK